MNKSLDISANRISRTVIFSVLAMSVNYVISLILTNYITENISADAYGFVSLAKSVSNYAIVFTSCLNSYASRFITLAYHKGDTEKASSYYTSVFVANLVLSFVVLLIAGVGIIFVDKLLNVPSELYRDIQLLLLLNIINYMLLATGSCFSAYAYISDKLDLMNAVKFLSYLAEASILYIMFSVLSPSIVYVGVALLASSVIIVICNFIATNKLVSTLRMKATLFSISAVKKLVISGIWNSINSIGNLLQSGLDLLVSNIMLTPLALGQLSVVKTLSAIFSTLCQLLASPFQPKLLKQYSEKNIDAVVSTLNLSMKVNGFFSVLLFVGFSVLGPLYYELWIPTQNVSILQRLTVVTFLGCVIEGIVYPLFYTYTLTLKNIVPCIVTVLGGLVNVFGKVILIKFFDMGVNAVVITTTLLAWAIHFIFTPVYAAKCLKYSLGAFYPTILRIVVAGVLMTMVFRGFNWGNMPTSWIALAVCAMVMTIISGIVYFLIVFNRAERAAVRSILSFIRR